MKRRHDKRINNQRGAVLIKFVLFLPVLIGMVAMAFDVSRLAVVRNELQNAADAGALAAASALYTENSTTINTGANQIGYDTATANISEHLPVEVNSGDVERGHWSFGTGTLPRGFTPNDTTSPADPWENPEDNLNVINAVRVTTRREETPVFTYFARFFGIESWAMKASAVAYVGFTGSMAKGDVDQPIAICQESVMEDGDFSCSIGRMINSGVNEENNETGGWTSFAQGDDVCNGGTNAQEVKGLVCNGGNPGPLENGEPMATSGGDIQSAFSNLFDCWTEHRDNAEVWEMTLPMVECPDNNVGPCQKMVGAVSVEVVWITGAGEDPQYNEAPSAMGGWSSQNIDGSKRWESFVDHFELKNVDGTPAPYAKKSIYFKPLCNAAESRGGPGGAPSNVPPKHVVLVE